MKHVRMLARGGALSLMIVGALLVMPGTPRSHAQENPPVGVDHLRGRWDGVVKNLNDADQSLTLLLNDFAPDPDNSAAMLATGCLAVGEAKALTPIAARAVSLGNNNFDLTVLGTVAGDSEGFTIRLAGLVETFGAGIQDDRVSGKWTTAEAENGWSATHHDRRRSKCPPVSDIPGLFFDVDVYVAHNYNVDDLVDRLTIFGGRTNIVSTGMLVTRPDGSKTVVPFFTDIFSPNVDFISQFRYSKEEPGDPTNGKVYTFTLLDALGNPIPGATETDIWTACRQNPPRNVNAVVTSELNISLSWAPVQVVPGFDPTNEVGFYQIGLHLRPEGPTLYGANLIQSANHLIPWNDFGGSAPGSPDGFDYGVGISQLDNGDYVIDVLSFSVSAPDDPGHGLECQVSDFAEDLFFTKADNTITFFNP
jgi:hypothetical protein